MSRVRVGVIFGGRSVEHEVSLVSARAVLQHLDRARYEVVPIGVSHEGRWLTAGDARTLLDGGFDGAQTSDATPAALTGDPTVRGLVPTAAGGPAQRVVLDVVFPLIHGTGGEDGTMQGLLELAGLPYVGSGVLGSSVGMDKGVMKAVFQSAGLACAPWRLVTRRRIAEDASGIAREVDETLGYPCFTKPCNGGSSVGVSKVKSRAGLAGALQLAAQYDRRVLIEQGIDGQEVECAVLGNDAPQASVVGEIVPSREFYDYQAKYVDEGSQLLIPAGISETQAARVREMSLAAFRALDLAGMARVDFFVRRSDGAVLINEVNTIPGFTPISMYPRLWEASGLPFAALVDRLVQLALERHEERQATRREYAPGQEAPGAR